MMRRKALAFAVIVGILGVVANPAPAAADYLAPGTPYADDFVLGPTVPGKWGPPFFGTGAAVTWSLMPLGFGITPFAAFLPGAFLAEVTAAFAAWAAVADITFAMVADSGTPPDAAGATGDIRLGGHVFDGPFGVLAHAFFPPVNGVSIAGDLHLDIAELWKIGFGGAGFDIFQVTAHELGHSIGLSHTAVPGSLMNPFYTEAFAGPQADDIAGAIFIYGALPAPPPPVPEPAVLLLFGTGLAAAGARRYRSKKC